MAGALAPQLPLWEGIVRLLAVAVLASAVGVERELREQEAGLRTHMLVGVGAALFVLAGNFAWSEIAFGNALGVVLDPSRVVAYVVTGIGFLGAGTIIKHGVSVRGLTTAASLWVVAAIGVTVAAGDYGLGIVATAAVLLSLWPVRELARLVGLRGERTHRLELELDPAASLAAVLAAIEHDDRIASVTVSEEPELRRVGIVLVERKAKLGTVLELASAVPGVRAASYRR